MLDDVEEPEASGLEVQLRPIQRELLSSQVSAHIRELILMGKLPPGSRVRQAEWATTLGVSRMPVRDAISALAAEGLLLQTPGGSAEVAALDLDDLGDVHYLNAIVVALAHRAAAIRITDGELAEVRALESRMEEAVARGDDSGASHLNWMFHAAINRAAHSTRLVAILRILSRSTPQSSYEVLPGWSEEAIRDHRKIISALERHSPDECFRTTHRHVSLRTEPLLSALKDRLKSPGRPRTMPPPVEPPPAHR